jgi:hypothetical protein
MYVTTPSLASDLCELDDELGSPLDQRGLHDHLVETGGMRALKARPVRVIGEPHDRHVRPGLGHFLRLDAGDVRDHEIGRIDAVRGDEPMRRQEPLELAPEEQVDPDEQDRGHGSDTSTLMGLEQGLQLIRTGAYFEAHEELEDEWRDAPAAERDFLQGLVHVAVAWYHAERGNRPGCERQLAKASRRLHAYTPAHRGVDVERVLEGVAEAQSVVASGSLALPAPPI